MKHIVASGLKRRMNVFVTLAICSSADDARWLRNSLPNNRIPDDYIARLDQAADAESVAIEVCAEQLRELRDIPGIDGAHLVATRNLATIVAAIEAAGLKR